jgi:hypothetical protein
MVLPDYSTGTGFVKEFEDDELKGVYKRRKKLCGL